MRTYISRLKYYILSVINNRYLISNVTSEEGLTKNKKYKVIRTEYNKKLSKRPTFVTIIDDFGNQSVWLHSCFNKC